MMDPFVSLMRRYCIDYTCSHDFSVCDEIMEPEYVVQISGMTLPRDAAYKPAVEMVFQRFPGLGLVVHEIFTNGERLAMRFSEHAADPAAKAALCCWRGIALYRWNGTKLTECRVQQDFLTQQRQLTSGQPEPLEPPHLDPWTTTAKLAPDPNAERHAAKWLAAGDLGTAESGFIDDLVLEDYEPLLDDATTEIHDLFSAGPRVAVHATVRGRYRAGLPDAEEHVGKDTELDFTGLLTVDGSRITEARVVTDRLGALSRLTGRPMF